jgi:hypothetical protein
MKPEAIEQCCQDLRRYLETALAGARGGLISVKVGRVVAVSRAYMWKKRYTWCLSKLLRRYRLNTGLYLLTKQQAEELLDSLDTLCAELHTKRREKKQEKPKHEKQAKPLAETAPATGPVGETELVGFANGERMPTVSFHLPRTLLWALDEYARRMNLTRSDVIRMAIRQMLDKMHEAEEQEKLEHIIII